MEGTKLYTEDAYDCETPGVNKMALNAWLKPGKLFPETLDFVTAIQDKVINTNIYTKHVLKDLSTTNDICRKCQEKSETNSTYNWCMWCTSTGQLHPSS